MQILPHVDPSEWQAMVNAAHFAMLVDSSVQYGLLEMVDEQGNKVEGSGVDFERCEKILREGALRGIYPQEK